MTYITDHVAKDTESTASFAARQRASRTWSASWRFRENGFQGMHGRDDLDSTVAATSITGLV